MLQAVDYDAGMKDRRLGNHYIKAWRQHRGLSLRRLAARMETEPGEPLLSHASLGRIENFEQPYNQEYLEALATALNCTVVDLLTVDPTKEGEVVDLMTELRKADAEKLDLATRLLREILNKQAS